MRSSAPIRLSRIVSEILMVMIDDDEQRSEEHAADGDRPTRRYRLVKVLLNNGLAAWVRVERDQRGGGPGGDRQHLAHEPADHREQARNQHHHQQDYIKAPRSASPPAESRSSKRDRHRLLLRSPLEGSASRSPTSQGAGIGRVRQRPVYSGRRVPRHPSCRPKRTGACARLPLAAMSATRSVSDPIALSARPESAPASPRADSGAKARVKPSLAASFSRAAALRHRADRARQRHLAEIDRIGRERRAGERRDQRRGGREIGRGFLDAQAARRR